MKKFCILEQGAEIGETLTLEKKALFTTGFSDFYRLNWKRPEDPEAHITQRNIVWSEGRSLLFQAASGQYEYYVFIDDDIEFQGESQKEIPKLIRDLLEKYRPLAGTFLNAEPRWNWIDADMDVCQSREAFPIAGFDLCLHFFSRDFAEVMFPVVYHGSGRSMWYAQWVCHKLFPLKQLCFTSVTIRNGRSETHLDKEKLHHIKAGYITHLFNSHVLDKSFKWDHKKIRQYNKAMFSKSPDKSPTAFGLNDLSKVYNTQNLFFRLRQPQMPKLCAILVKMRILPLLLKRVVGLVYRRVY